MIGTEHQLAVLGDRVEKLGKENTKGAKVYLHVPLDFRNPDRYCFALREEMTRVRPLFLPSFEDQE
jgi:hypothetical protein